MFDVSAGARQRAERTKGGESRVITEHYYGYEPPENDLDPNDDYVDEEVIEWDETAYESSREEW